MQSSGFEQLTFPLRFESILIDPFDAHLTPEIARHSVYAYLENELGMTIATSKRTMTVEHMTQVDETYLDLKDYNCLAVITNQTYDDNGIQFEYTQSRHRPDYFQFQDVAARKKK